MKQFQGVWFPDHETHLQAWMAKAGEIVDGKGTYQVKKLRAAVDMCKRRRVAVDVGGHVGLWSMQLAKMFDEVHAFEPVAEHRACFQKNVFADAESRFAKHPAHLHAMALGEKEGSIAIHTTKFSSGDSWVKGKGDIPMRTLDSFELTDVDFIKIDTEGYEKNVLLGAAVTIVNCKPVIIVEQKRDMSATRFGLPALAAVTYLQALGYTIAKEMSGDYIMVPAP